MVRIDAGGVYNENPYSVIMVSISTTQSDLGGWMRSYEHPWWGSPIFNYICNPTQVAVALAQYPDESISRLVISGHGSGCG